MAKFQFKKRYGQNFLKDEKTIESIVSSIEPSEDDLIIEIGPGAGALTKKIQKYGCNLIAFEIDEDTKKYLVPLENERTKIVFCDFLDTDIKSFLKDYKYDKLYFLGNLPYYITTPIIEHIIESKVAHQSLTIMVQKEVAERFLANPGTKDYGYMTVLLNHHYEISKVVDVTRDKFFPAPKVDSTVLKLTYKNPKEIDYEKFKTILKEAFQFKRKNISNNLKKYDKTKLEQILNEHGKSSKDRAEELDLETLLDLTKLI